MASRKKKTTKAKKAPASAGAGRRAPNPTGKGSTTTRPQMRARLEKVEEIMTSFDSYGATCRRIAEEFGVTERMAAEYVAKVYARWDEEAKEHRSKGREKERQIRRLYAHGKKFADNPTALRWIEDLLARVCGTLAAEKRQDWQIDPEKLTDDQINRLLAGEDPAAVLGRGDGP